MVQQIERGVEKLERYILLRQSQLAAVLFLEDHRKVYPPQQLQQEYVKNHSQILDFIIPP